MSNSYELRCGTGAIGNLADPFPSALSVFHCSSGQDCIDRIWSIGDVLEFGPFCCKWDRCP